MNNNIHGNRQFPTKKEAVLVVVVTFTLLIFVSGIFSRLIAAGRKEAFLTEAFVIIPALFYVYKKGYSFKEIFRLNNVSSQAILYAVIIGVSFLMLSDEFDRLIRLVFPFPGGAADAETGMNELFKANSTYEFLVIFISGVLMAGIFEEMLFRGFLQKAFEREMDVTRAVFLSAFMFAFVHYIWVIWLWYLIQIIMLGVILGVLAWKSDSIYPAAAVHIVHNLISIYYTSKEPSAQELWYEWKGHISPIIILLAIYLIIYSFKRFYKSCDEYKERCET